MSRCIFSAVLVGAVFAVHLSVLAQNRQPEQYRPSTEATSPTYQRPTPSEIVQLKAMARAEQRAQRIAAQEWSGASQARYLSSPTPFTSPDPLWWDRPVQRPYAWYEALKRPFEQRILGDFSVGPYVPVRAATQHQVLQR